MIIILINVVGYMIAIKVVIYMTLIMMQIILITIMIIITILVITVIIRMAIMIFINESIHNDDSKNYNHNIGKQRTKINLTNKNGNNTKSNIYIILLLPLL